jgi:hypothetical protein
MTRISQVIIRVCHKSNQLFVYGFFLYLRKILIKFFYSIWLEVDHWHPPGASSTLQSGLESDEKTSPVCLLIKPVCWFWKPVCWFWKPVCWFKGPDCPLPCAVCLVKDWPILKPEPSQVTPSWHRSSTNLTLHRNPNFLWT